MVPHNIKVSEVFCTFMGGQIFNNLEMWAYEPNSEIEYICQVSWGCRIHRLHLCRRVRLPQSVSCGLVGWGCRIHQLHLCRRVRLPQCVSCGTVDWGGRIHRLHLYREVRLPQCVSYGPVDWGCRIYRLRLCVDVKSSPSHNECPGYDTKQSDGEVPVLLEHWGMLSTPFIAIAPRSILACSGNTL